MVRICEPFLLVRQMLLQCLHQLEHGVNGHLSIPIQLIDKAVRHTSHDPAGMPGKALVFVSEPQVLGDRRFRLHTQVVLIAIAAERVSIGKVLPRAVLLQINKLR